MKNPTIQHLADIKLLTSSWQTVQSKGTAGGIDRVSLDDYQKHCTQNLKKLSAKLIEGQWKPQPYMGIQIPKKNEGMRNLGLLSVEDKIVQQGIKTLIEPIIEKSLTPSCYAYRHGKGHFKAVRRAFHECSRAVNKVYIRMDIKDCFCILQRYNDLMYSGGN